MKSANEIKKGLECCYGNEERRFCEMCPFGVKTDEIYPTFICSNFDAVGEGALALIQQLQDDLQLEKKRTDALAMELAVLKNAKKQLEERAHQLDLLNIGLLVEKAQLEAERDAMMEYVHGRCPMCKHYARSIKEEPCASCYSASGHNDNWEWRGAQKEESDA